MKKNFSREWKASKKPSKQRKYTANAPKHLRNKAMAAHLSAELRKKHSTRSITVRKGDKVRVARGQFRGKSGRIEDVDTKKSKVYITGIEFIKKDGSKALYPIHASNLVVEDLNMDDKKRMKRAGGKSS
ncbi:50S ribosomal protein L24 [Candidatus Woesearchaeota archaeon]|nr:50S ribosomal protein L24 [Candidatus Woesearchaeota archaeon]